ncbi:MAG: hypothetical protein ACR2PZ_07450 [Pseudomonadales bacterium]
MAPTSPNQRIPLLLLSSPTPFAGTRSTLQRFSRERLGVLLCACLLACVFAQQAQAEAQGLDMSQHSDQALTTLAAEWDTLSPATRRVLLKEMQQRMSRQPQGRTRASGSLQIRSERRFGRRVRQADGSVVTIETRVVRLRSRPEAPLQGLPAAKSKSKPRSDAVQVASGPFGVGFEQRSARRRIILVPRNLQPAADAVDASDAAQPQ